MVLSTYDITNMEITNNGSGFKEKGGYNKIESWNEETTTKISESYLEIIKQIGENPDREGLKDTPLRVAKAMQFSYTGIQSRSCSNTEFCKV